VDDLDYNGERSLDLLHKSAELFFDFGFMATTMSQIAESMSLTKAGLYHYTRSKSELLFNVLSFAMDMVDRGIVTPASHIEDPEERLEFMIRKHLQLITEHGGRLTIVFDEARHLPEPMKGMIQDRQSAYFELVRATLSDIKTRDRTRLKSPQISAAFILMTIEASARWLMDVDDIDQDFLIDQTARYILGGIKNTA